MRANQSRADAGFTLIEVLVALAVVASVLAAIGTVVSTTIRGSRGIQDRLAASGVAETLLAGMANRASVRIGRTTGETSGYRWAVNVTPIRQGVVDAGNWEPCGVTIEVRGERGPLVQLASVVLLPRTSQ